MLIVQKADDVHNLPGRSSAVVFKCLLKLVMGCSQTSLALFLPPLYTSLPRRLPQAFCGPARKRGVDGGRKCSTQRARVKSSPLRRGNAPTCPRTRSNTRTRHTETRALARTPTRSNTQSARRLETNMGKHGAA